MQIWMKLALLVFEKNIHKCRQFTAIIAILLVSPLKA